MALEIYIEDDFEHEAEAKQAADLCSRLSALIPADANYKLLLNFYVDALGCCLQMNHWTPLLPFKRQFLIFIYTSFLCFRMMITDEPTGPHSSFSL